jgi:hypothetical protein
MGGAASEIETAKELLDSGAITPGEFAAIKAKPVGSARAVVRPVAASRLSRASLAHAPGRAAGCHGPATTTGNNNGSSGASQTRQWHEAK